MEQYLRNLYYDLDSPTSYTSFTNLWRKIKEDNKDSEITKDDLKKWLEEQYTYSLHKPYKRPKIYRKTTTYEIDDLWQADLVIMSQFSVLNDGYVYLLCVIDCFSKYAWVEILKSKTGSEVAQAFERIFKQGRRPMLLQTDKGTEFYNDKVKKLLDDRGIKLYSSDSDKKASIVERFNRTLKSRMWKYFTANETRKWVDILQKLVHDYNHTFHSAIKMTPVEGSNPENSQAVWYNIYGAYLSSNYEVPKYKVGETVRISKYKSTFAKGYLPNYTEEFFKIKEVRIGLPTVYKLTDLKNEELNGIFYEEELSPYRETEESTYKIEKIIGRKTVKGKKFVLVKYKGWPEKFNEWLPAENVTIK